MRRLWNIWVVILLGLNDGSSVLSAVLVLIGGVEVFPGREVFLLAFVGILGVSMRDMMKGDAAMQG